MADWWDRFVIPLVIPVIVTLIGTAAAYGLPKLLEKGRQLTYAIDGPVAYINDAVADIISIKIRGTRVEDLYGYQVTLTNSGDRALTDLPVQLRFAPTSPQDFRIIGTTSTRIWQD